VSISFKTIISKYNGPPAADIIRTQVVRYELCAAAASFVELQWRGKRGLCRRVGKKIEVDRVVTYITVRYVFILAVI